MVSRKEFVCLVLILSLVINPFIVILNAGGMTEAYVGEYTLSRDDIAEFSYFTVNILYDPNDAICIKTAESVFQSLSGTGLVLNLQPILSSNALSYHMFGSWMNIYIFHGTSEGMIVGAEFMPWELISDFIFSFLQELEL